MTYIKKGTRVRVTHKDRSNPGLNGNIRNGDTAIAINNDHFEFKENPARPINPSIQICDNWEEVFLTLPLSQANSINMAIQDIVDLNKF